MVHLPFYGTGKFCHYWDGIEFGSCLERLKDKDENEELIINKDDARNITIEDAKYEGIGGKKICIERAEGLDYF